MHGATSPAPPRKEHGVALVWFKIICKENKEQKEKRKYHAGTSHPNDRGGFVQWFGGCSLITTLYVWFPACWAPMVVDRLFCWMLSPNDTAHSKGLPLIIPQHHRGITAATVLLLLVMQRRLLTSPGIHVQVEFHSSSDGKTHRKLGDISDQIAEKR